MTVLHIQYQKKKQKIFTRTILLSVSFLFLVFLNFTLSTECTAKQIAKQTAEKKTPANKIKNRKTSVKKKSTSSAVSKTQNHSLYFTLSAIPLKIKNLKNIDITDYYNDDGDFEYVANEGRLTLNTDKLNQTSYLFGFSIGYKYLYKNLGFYVDSNFNAAYNIYMYSFYAGFEYRYKIMPKYYLGVSPKIGYSLLFVDLKNTEAASGFASSTVIFKKGDPLFEIKSNDSINAFTSALSLQILLTGGYIINNNVDIIGNAGLIFAKYRKLNYFSKFHIIDGNSKQVVEHLTYTKTDTDGKIQSIGLIINIGASYKL